MGDAGDEVVDGLLDEGAGTEIRSVDLERRGRPPDAAGHVAQVLSLFALLERAARPTGLRFMLEESGSDRRPPRWAWSMETEEAEVSREAAAALLGEALAGRGEAVLLERVAIEAEPGMIEADLHFGEISTVSISWTAEPLLDPAMERIRDELIEAGWDRDVLAHVFDTEEPPPVSETAGAHGRILSRGMSIDLVWRGTSFSEPGDQAGVVVEAIAALAPAVEPLDFNVTCGFRDRAAGGRPRRCMFSLREGEAAEGWKVGVLVSRTAPRIGAEEMRSLCREAMAPARPGGLFGFLRAPRPVMWTTMSVSSARVRLPGSMERLDELLLDSVAGPVRVPVTRGDGGDGGATVRRLELPDEGEQPEHRSALEESPVALLFMPGEPISLAFDLHWSPWAEPGSPGRELIETAVGRLIRLGWERVVEPV